MHFTKTVTLPGGGIAAITPQGRGFNPQTVPNGAASPAMPRPQVSDLGGGSPFSQVLGELTGGQKLPGNMNATNEDLPLIDPQQVKQQAEQLVSGNSGQSGVNILVPSAPTTGANRRLSATEQKEFYEAQDITDSVGNALSVLDQVDKIRSEPMYTGFGSTSMAFGNRVPVLGHLFDDDKAANTTAMDNLLKELAYSRLKATFPGQISNSEREALERLQALSSYSRPEQDLILAEARKVLSRQYETAYNRQRGIETGEIYRGGVGQTAAPPQNVQQFQEGTIADGPNGEVIVFTNGRWVKQ